jgi:hypothetical protein
MDVAGYIRLHQNKTAFCIALKDKLLSEINLSCDMLLLGCQASSLTMACSWSIQTLFRQWAKSEKFFSIPRILAQPAQLSFPNHAGHSITFL